MLTALGHHGFDSTHRALVLGLVLVSHPVDREDVLRRAASLSGNRPDGLVLVAHGAGPALAPAVETLAAVAGPPVLVRTADAEILRACLDAGACAGHDPTGLTDPAYLPTVVDAGASVVVGRPLAAPADRDHHAEDLLALAGHVHDAGVDRERILVDVRPTDAGLPPGGVATLGEVGELARAGWSVQVEIGGAGAGPDRDLAAAAGSAVAIGLGARVLVTDDVHGCRRVAAVMAELLRARETSGPPGDDAEVLV